MGEMCLLIQKVEISRYISFLTHRMHRKSPTENNSIFQMGPRGVEDSKRSESHLGEKTLTKGMYAKLMCLIHFTISVATAHTRCVLKHT